MPKKRKKQPAPKSTGPKCPFCKKPTPDAGTTTLHYCPSCKRQFDNDPDEGGDYSDRDPSARLDREERNKQRFPVQRGWR